MGKYQIEFGRLRSDGSFERTVPDIEGVEFPTMEMYERHMRRGLRAYEHADMARLMDGHVVVTQVSKSDAARPAGSHRGSRGDLVKAYVVSHGEGAAMTWAWIEAESKAQIEAAFRDLVVYDPAPEWATPELMEDFGAYRIECPLDPWLEKLRRKSL